MKLQRTLCSWELSSFGLIEALGPNATVHNPLRCAWIFWLSFRSSLSDFPLNFHHPPITQLLQVSSCRFTCALSFFPPCSGSAAWGWSGDYYALRFSLLWRTRDGSHTASLFHLLINHANEILKATQMCFSREPALALAPDYSWSVHEGEKGEGKYAKEIQT